MAVLSAQGTLSILSSDTVGTTKVVSGLAFQPKAILFFGSGHASGSDGIEAGDYKGGFGYATGAASRRAIAGWSDHAVATTSCRGAYSETACFITSGTGAIDAALDIQSIDSGGFTAVIDDQFPVDYRIHWLALGGSDLLEVAVGSFQTPTAIGTQDITDVGFKPDCVLFAKAGRSVNAPPDAVQDTMWCIGVYDGTNQWAACVDSNHAVVLGSTQTMRFLRSGECLTGFNAAATQTEAHASGTVMLSNGFRLNWTEVGGTTTWNFYLALRGGSYKAGTVLTQTGTSTAITASDHTFEPSATLFVSVGDAENAADTPTDHNALSIGCATLGNQGLAAAMRDNDAITVNTDCDRAIDYNAVYLSITSGGAIDGEMYVQSFDATGFTCFMRDADPSQRIVGYLSMGPPTVALWPHEGTKPWSSVWRGNRV